MATSGAKQSTMNRPERNAKVSSPVEVPVPIIETKKVQGMYTGIATRNRAPPTSRVVST